MLSNRAMGNGAVVIGVLLLVPAVAKLFAGAAAREPCNRLCFVYDLLAHFFGVPFANAASGSIWLVIAILFLATGLRARRKTD